MRVIPPREITDGRLISSTAPEPGVGEVAWSSGTTYGVGDVVIVGSPTATVTMTVASPCVVTWIGHGLADATSIVFTTTGALPTGLTAGTRYYVINSTDNTFQVSTDPAGAPIVTTGSQSGTHTATAQVHRKYESLEAANNGHSPMTNTDKWLDIGPTNRWAMFDLYRSTATTVASPLTVVIEPGTRCDSIGLVGLVADQVQVTVSDGASTIYSETFSLRTRIVTGWYTYFFTEFTSRSVLAIIDIPPATGAEITITITRTGGDVSCGGVVIGRSVKLGETQTSAVDDAENFSKIERDEFGISSLIQRRTVPRTTQTVWCHKGLVNQARDIRQKLNAEPAFWMGLDDSTDGYFEAVQILGIYKQFSIALDHPDHAVISLELEEV